MLSIYLAYFHSPLDWLELVSDSQTLLAINFVRNPKHVDKITPFLRETIKQLKEYFKGQRKKFSLSLSLSGTAWQNRVWLALTQVPYGAVISYQDLAEAVGQSGAARAVGQAVGANPLPIIIPCHRVLAGGGKLGGYSGGLKKKMWLLQHEGHF